MLVQESYKYRKAENKAKTNKYHSLPGALSTAVWGFGPHVINGDRSGMNLELFGGLGFFNLEKLLPNKKITKYKNKIENEVNEQME